MSSTIRRGWFALSCFVLASGPVHAGQSSIDLKEIADGYNQTIDMIDTIWARTHQSADFVAEGGSSDYELDAEWAVDGPRYFLRKTALVGKDKRPGIPVCLGSNGKTTWSHKFHLNGGPLTAVMTRPAGAGEALLLKDSMYNEYTVYPALGTSLFIGSHSLSAESLSTLLQNPAAKLSASSEDGALATVDFGDIKSTGDQFAISVRATFARDFGWLPQSMHFVSPVETISYSVASFKFVSTPLGRVPLPHKWTRTSPLATRTTEILEVKLNEPLASSLFSALVPNGIKVVSASSREDEARKSHLIDKEKRRRDRETEKNNNAHRPLAVTATSQPLRAESQGSNVGWILAIGGLFFLCVSGVLWMRR